MSRYEPSPRVPAYYPTDGIPIAIVGQSPGHNEVKEGVPFIGASGRLLRECCRMAGLPWFKMMRTNLIGFNPPHNEFAFFCAKREEVGKDYPHPAIGSGMYLKPEWLPELDRLKTELEAYKPNLVITCGNEALWALCGVTGITKYQGAIAESTLIPGLKVLPIFHPASALREYQNRAYIAQALFKAAVEYGFPEIRRPNREIWIYPGIADLDAWHKQERIRAALFTAEGSLLSVDIESPHGHIDCIAFSFRPECSLVIPFWSDLREGHSYWRTIEDELAAWDFVEELLSTFPVLGQNFACFDAWKLLSDIGIFPRHIREDTMVAHHAYQPELAKDLGTLTAVYCNDTAYKQLRPRGAKTEKRED